MVQGQQEVTFGTKGTVWDVQSGPHDSVTSIQILRGHLLRRIFQLKRKKTGAASSVGSVVYITQTDPESVNTAERRGLLRQER